MPKHIETSVLSHICSSAEARSRLLTAMVADQETVADDHLLSSALAVSINSIYYNIETNSFFPPD
jgi:hypothetical protein